jgi:hypothetical protein
MYLVTPANFSHLTNTVQIYNVTLLVSTDPVLDAAYINAEQRAFHVTSGSMNAMTRTANKMPISEHFQAPALCRPLQSEGTSIAMHMSQARILLHNVS